MKTMTESDHIQAHAHSAQHRKAILKSEQCGCFHCMAIFHPSEVVDWTDEENEEGAAALCPKCGIDTVIGSESGYPIETAFLRKMRRHWFDS